MAILSWQFALFVLVSVVIFHILPMVWKYRWLYFISILFFIFLDIRFAFVFLILLFFNYFLAFRGKKQGQDTYFTVAIWTNVLSFSLLKWLTSPYYSLSGLPVEKLLLPIGFSFYILQMINFQSDLKTKQLQFLPSFTSVALYLSYFPKLLAGPIEKPRIFFERLDNPLVLTNDVVGRSFSLILNGLMRKIVIADMLRVLVPPITGEGIITTWISVFSYGLQIYNDFLGYTSIVRGVSLLFGLELSQNFQSPYLARNFSEFWSKWHISLTAWLRQFIYFPISRKLARLNSGLGLFLNMVFPPLITMLISGFWHGATFGMLVWGGLHGILLILERVIYEVFPNAKPINLDAIGQIVSRSITFFSVNLVWIPFFAIGFNQSIRIYGHLFQNPVLIGQISPVIPLLLFLLSFILDFFWQNSKDELWWRSLSVPVRSLFIVFAIFIILSSLTYQLQEEAVTFIYQGF